MSDDSLHYFKLKALKQKRNRYIQKNSNRRNKNVTGHRYSETETICLARKNLSGTEFCFTFEKQRGGFAFLIPNDVYVRCAGCLNA